MILEKLRDKHSKKINKTEILKQKYKNEDIMSRLKRYAKEGYDAISEDDKNYFLKSLGIFDRPATFKQFMMRIRISAGRLSSHQAIVLGNVAKKYANDYIDLTTRMQVELRYLDIKNIPSLIEELESVGITSYQTGVDNFRNIVSDPLDGVAHDNIIETADLIEKMQEIYLKKDEWINAIPRKFNTSISGSMTNRCNLFAHDCCFALANRDGEYGFNVYLGGKVGIIAKSADIFLKREEVVVFYEALIKVFRDFGFRDSRNKNRLYYLIKEAGMENIILAVKKYASIDFKSAGETIVKTPRVDENQGKIAQKDGSFALHMVVPAGIFSGTSMIEAAHLAKEFGEGKLRISTTQNLFILGVKDTQKALGQKPFDRYKNVSSAYFNHLVACAGIEHCPFGVIPNKPDAIEMADFLSKEVKLPQDAKVRMHWSACVKGCGVHELGDIGFIGCKVKENGKTVYGVHIQIGGKSTSVQKEAYSVLKSIPLTKAKYYVKELVLAYKDNRKKQESFEEFEDRVFKRYSKEAIEFLLLWNVDVANDYHDLKVAFSSSYKPMYEQDEIVHFGKEIYKKATGENPFGSVIVKKIPHPSFVNKTLPRDIGDIIYNMVTKKYEVFSEIVIKLRKER